MEAYEVLYDINEHLKNDEMWKNILENMYHELGVKNLDELVDKALEEQDDTVILNLIDEGENLISLREGEISDYFFEEDEY